MKILELFSGSGIMSKTFESRGHKSLTVDIELGYGPDVCCDVLDIDSSMFNGFKPDIVWASPPCTCFSVASIGRNWTGSRGGTYVPKSNNALIAIETVKKTLEIINELDTTWFIENPRGMLRKMPFMIGKHHEISYCRYGDNRMKPTDIWTNSDWIPRPMCNKNNPDHAPAPRGSKTGTQCNKKAFDKATLPIGLCEDIVRYMENI